MDDRDRAEALETAIENTLIFLLRAARQADPAGFERELAMRQHAEDFGVDIPFLRKAQAIQARWMEDALKEPDED